MLVIRWAKHLFEPAKNGKTGQSSELSSKIDELISAQKEIKVQIEALSAEQSYMRPTLGIWIKATIFSMIALFFICAATSYLVHVAAIDNAAEQLHQQAQANRSQATEDVAETIETLDEALLASPGQKAPSQLFFTETDDSLDTLKDSHNLFDQADKLDSEAFNMQNGSDFTSYVAQIISIISSAILGGIIGWAITQVLITRRKGKLVN